MIIDLKFKEEKIMYLYKINEQIITLTKEQFKELIKAKNINESDLLFVEL